MATFRRRRTYLQSSEGFGLSSDNDTEKSMEALERQTSHVKWSQPQLDPVRICKQLGSHKSFEVKAGYTMEGLPKFDDLTGYGKTEEEEFTLWSREVSRLCHLANSSDQVRLEGDESWFGKADRHGYIRLHKIAIQLQDAVDICIHDNELVLIENLPHLANLHRYKAVHKRLIRDYNPNERKERYQRRLRLEENNDQFYHALVNYVTGMMLRVLLQSMRGTFWEDNCVITIAKFAAKLKVLIVDLPESAASCLERTMATRFRSKLSGDVLRVFEIDGISAGPENKEAHSRRSEAQRDWIDAELRYFIVQEAFHSGISRLLTSAVSNLSSNEDTEMSADIFDTSVVMYEDYITNRRLLLSAQRDATIGAAADPNVVASAGAAFQVCLDAWEHLGEDVKPGGYPAEEDWTLLYWKWTKINPRTYELEEGNCTSSRKLSSMQSVIKALVPYLMVCGRFPGELQELSSKVFLISDPTAPVRPIAQKPFLAVFIMRTSAYMTHRSNIRQDDSCTVSESTIAQKKALAQAPSPTLHGMFADEPGTDDDDATLRKQRREQRRAMSEAVRKVQEWVIDETSIVISHRWYAWGGLAGCAVLVLGGVAIGLTVENRILGVDPFNMSTFCWVLAGFILLFMKSLRVENWPWSRFFRGEVVCRSVSEVHSVTGMDPQTILAVLLRLEPRMSLYKRGPFEEVFSKRDMGGFSIDVPPKTSTLLEGGVILVKVQSVLGPALASIKSDIWTRYDSVSPKGDTFQEDVVICRDFLDPGTWGTGTDKLPLFTMSRGDLQWYRVVGVFEKEAYFD